jgi:hypothetical protein
MWRERSFNTKLSAKVLVGAVFLPAIVLLWFLYFGLFFCENYTKGAGYGDLPFHLNLISSFAYGCNSNRSSLFDLVAPFFAKEPLPYPVLSNFYSAFLLKCFSASRHASIVIPSAILDFSLFAVLAGLVSKFSRCFFPCFFAPWLFLFGGGLGFVNFLQYPNTRLALYTDFVHSWGRGVRGSWFQPIIHVLLPQRASLHSLPMAFSILLVLMHIGDPPRLRLRASVAVGLLPQVQPHAIIACAE